MESIKGVSELQVGSLLKEDVYCKTKYPIMRKGTELTLEHIEVLQVFGVKQVKVEENLNKSDETNSDALVDTDNTSDNQYWLKNPYDKAVQDFKREFNNWRSGQLPQVAKIRSFIIPLLEKFIAQKTMLTMINDFSTPEEYLYHHPIAMGILSAAIGQKMGYEKGDIIQLGLAGTLADCGMAKIAPSIIEKTASLSQEEFNEVKKHTLFSVKMIQTSPLIRQDMKLAILQHHERLDGSGYPRGEKMETILVFSQILAVADVFHAMTSDRLYKPKLSPFKVIEMIKEDEFGKFDIKVVDALQNLVGNLSIGTRVKLNNGELGEVMFLHRDTPLRPMIKKDSDGLVIDLSTNRDLVIESILE
ncbi:HD-GYP domain-containing protein [Sporosarcina sp. FSL W8-0480]|uniref:HD-GYP domain-containing protein n=1 Tax=Sporosarcina sp. FSL W8-0480 TaxID=2954701 RepID=UPI0030D81C15